MKLKPIIFSLPMVQAILDGRKTQTRRVHAKPAYAVGDRLWVRETWRPLVFDCDRHWRIEYKDGVINKKNRLFANDPCCEKEDNLFSNLCEELDKKGIPFDKETGLYNDTKDISWRASIHMPFGAHRIELKVTAVRQERLQDISATDAIAEGIEYINGQWRNYTKFSPYTVRFPEDSFQSLWESINGPDSWGQNPLVYVYEFERLIP